MCLLFSVEYKELLPYLEPSSQQEVWCTGGCVLITLEDHDVDLSPAFTIFLSTREPSVRWGLYTAHDSHMHSLYQLVS